MLVSLQRPSNKSGLRLGALALRVATAYLICNLNYLLLFLLFVNYMGCEASAWGTLIWFFWRKLFKLFVSIKFLVSSLFVIVVTSSFQFLLLSFGFYGLRPIFSSFLFKKREDKLSATVPLI